MISTESDTGLNGGEAQTYHIVKLYQRLPEAIVIISKSVCIID